MKNKIKNGVIVFLCVIIAGLGWKIYDYSQMELVRFPLNEGKCVPDEISAIKIAQVVYKARLGVDFDENEFAIRNDKENNEWNVWLRDYAEEKGKRLVGGERGIYINKDVGTITRVYFYPSLVDEYYQNKEKYGAK